MDGMKIRLPIIKNCASTKARNGVCGVILLLVLVFSLSPSTAQESTPAGIMDVIISPENNSVSVTVTVKGSPAPQEFMLDNPRRLVLDFPNTINHIKPWHHQIGVASVKRLRVSQFQAEPIPVARMVFDLEEGHGKHSVAVEKNKVSIFFLGQSEPAGNQTTSAGEQGTAPTAPSRKPENPAQQATRTAATPVPMTAAAEERKAVPEQERKKSAVAPPAAAVPVSAVAAVESPEVAAIHEALPLPAVLHEVPEQPPLVASLAPAALNPAHTALANPSRFAGQPLTLDLVNIPLTDFFRLMADEGGINIVLDPSVKGTLSMKVVKLPWDQIFEAALTNNGLDKQVEGSMIRIARKSTLQDEARQRESLNKANLLAADLETRIKRLNYAKAVDLINAVSDQKTVRGSIVVEERTNSLILTDIPSSIEKQLRLIEALDIPQPQVEIEARIVAASRNFAREIGIQFGFVQGNLERVTVGGPNTFGTIGGTRPSATPSSTYAAGQPERGRGASSDTASESGAVSTGDGGNYNVNLPAGRAFGGVGISVGNIFDTFLLDAAITAGESKGKAKLISQPKVTAQNNSQAVITQGLRFPVPVNANNTITIQFFNAALTLTAIPQITYEGNIVLDLRVENNTADFANNVNGVPSIRTSESMTRVLVSDGGTTVIGGILIDEESDSENRVPGLGAIPIIGHLFRNTAVLRNTQEILFFVTPRIVR
jgi:type IV pilus secretin PilQ/predicted competence protein